MKMKFTKLQKKMLLRRFEYKNCEKTLDPFGSRYINIACPLREKYRSPKYRNDSCETCKRIHQHKCMETLKEIVGGELHFHSDDFQIFWELDNEKVVKKELEKITQAIKGDE